ncbi:hypothetical protein FH609_019860 [Streptomyces sp. 3MP-14]|uniref:Uncharacterized protein n=1 Tax=Streptomyces mimosae TaxID=2586635 RepID=A0A5N5ZT51_9ACTN|nr:MULTISPECIES: hypothetical protein [Streptomyces]KAB8158906.1 hypothetical protein FH607_028840 [Streptomyces mimosae]KAB8174854.1 hypothetical protein FH609_019860 [Streptomyces sp. 3MP-14]
MPTSDLYLDYDMLRATRDNIRQVADLMERPCQAMAEAEGSAMGVARLVGRMDDFGDEWEYGISQLREFAEQAAAALDEVIHAFDSIDEELAGSLEQGGSGDGGVIEA